MRATGIVRRIDDLGRVVIPKEIRRTMRIREGDPLEIFTDHNGGIILKKYSPMGELFDFAHEYAEAMAKTLECTVLICDQESVLAASRAGQREYQDKPIGAALQEKMRARRPYIAAGAGIAVVDGIEAPPSQVIYPIIAEGEVCGAVILMEKQRPLGEPEIKACGVAAGFFASQLS